MVGLTGGIGAGKSTALAMFGDAGAIIVSADRIVHDLYSRPEVMGLLVEHFGTGVLDVHGKIDRRRLARMVRGRPKELRWLERLTHPLVAIEIERHTCQAPFGSVVVCEIPLLFESHYEKMFDLVVTVEAGRDTRLSRSADRLDEALFLEFERLQASTEERVLGSDLVFYNDGDVDRLRSFVNQAYVKAAALIRDGE